MEVRYTIRWEEEKSKNSAGPGHSSVLWNRFTLKVRIATPMPARASACGPSERPDGQRPRWRRVRALSVPPPACRSALANSLSE